MNLLFWNLGGNDNTDLIKSLLVERDADFAAFAEHQSVNFDLLCGAADFPYKVWDPVYGVGKVRVLMREGCEGVGVFGQNRYVGLTVNSEGRKLNLFAVHLQDCRNDPQGVARAETVRRLVADLRGQQEEQNCADSVVLGDFNVQPFSNEMIWATLLNATFFKEVATRVHDKKAGSEMYPFMYNPTLEHFTEAGGNCGSFYSSSGADTFYWYCLDQAVVSPSLANSVVEYRYLRKIGDTSLIADIAPKKSISDHLPLFVRLDRSYANGQ